MSPIIWTIFKAKNCLHLGEAATVGQDLGINLFDSAFVQWDIRETHVIGLKPGQSPKRILVADDNADNRALLPSMLEPVGFVVREVVDGKTAIEAYSSWRPHLICMDRRMPVMDGHEATKAIRELPGGERVKIIAVAASVFDEQCDNILGVGCDELVRKPVLESKLFDAIGRQLGSSTVTPII